ncbi:alpha/beta fold hydrolase [bacterium]|nr:MAG: alpha/beta fold hydrolase [bacterium]
MSILLTVFGGILGAYVAVCFRLADNYVHPHRYPAGPVSDALADRKIPLDGLNVPVWTNAKFDPKGTVFVFSHGYGGNRAHWSDLMKRLAKAGYSSVALSMPGQDESPVEGVGFGVGEAETIRSAAAWLRSQGARKVVGVGLSMGGAATWLASDALDAVVTDAAYPTFDQASERFLDRALPKASLLLRPMILIGANKADVVPSEIRPVDVAAGFKGPALVIQGADDRLFPTTFADELSKAAHCDKWLVPGAGHADCASMAEEEYAHRLVGIAKRLE